MATRLPKEIEEALSRLEPQLAQAFRDAIQRMADAVSIQKVENALAAGNIEAAIDALRLEGVWFNPLPDAIRAGLVAGGDLALSGLRLRDPFDGTRFILGFDGRAARAEQWVAMASSNLITEIVKDQREMAREVIRAGIEAGKGPRTTALDLVGRMNRATGKREGGFIGLTSQQSQWALNAERELRDLDAGYFSRTLRDKRSDSMVSRAIRDGKPLAEADVRRLVARYRDRLLKARADTIAENEALNALRAGQAEGFRQLVDSGKVRNDQIVKGWSATMDGRTRHDHRMMNGQKVRGVDGAFTFPDGTQALFPGDTSLGASAAETIRCRCWCEWRIRSDLMRGED